MISFHWHTDTTEDVVSREGYVFNFFDERWRLSKDIDIPVSAVSKYLSQRTDLAFRQVLAFYAVSNAPTHCRNIFERAKHYFESTLGQEPFSADSLLSYRSMLDKTNEWYLGTLRGFIRQWYRMGYPNIDEDVIHLLEKWRLKGNEKGYAVQSMCPESGPLSDIELQGVVQAVVTAFSEGRLELFDTAVTLTVAMTGRRPVQVTALKAKDLIKRRSPEGIDNYFVSFPCSKQRLESWRTSFSEFPINEDLWLILQKQLLVVKGELEDKLAEAIPMKLICEIPLFMDLKKYDPYCSLADQLHKDVLHVPSAKVTSVLKSLSKKINVKSERTGLLVHLTPVRFRYTLGTNLAREGKREFVIAEALDHSDTQNAGVYVKNVPGIVKHINRAVALKLAPLAQAFQGVLVVSESDAVRGKDPSSRITNGAVGVGTCGSYGFCGAIAPVACYTCNNFQPWVDGPHEDVLEGLINERDHVANQTDDLRIASVNDRLILAVGDVINRCNKMKNEVC